MSYKNISGPVTTTIDLSSAGYSAFSGINLTSMVDPSTVGGIGVLIDVVSDISIIAAPGSVTGGVGSGATSGGAGVNVSAGTLDNDGTITGGSNSSGTGGVGVLVDGGTLVNESGGNITGGSGTGAIGPGVQTGGVGVNLTSGTLVTDGTISGGLSGNGTTRYAAVQFNGPSLTLDVGAGAKFYGGTGNYINNFKQTDVIDFTNLSQNAITVVAGGKGNTITVTTTLDGTLQFKKSGSDTVQLVNDGNGGTDVILVGAACYRRGTRILTDTGERPIENLAIGDRVITVSGEARAVRWLGFRGIDCSRHTEPRSVWPIRIGAGAFADGVPHRDLWVSPGHSVLIEGVLIQADKLVNGVTIVQVPETRVEYWHVEVDSHDIIYADGLESESYLDTGNRSAFTNGGAFVDAFPDFRPKHWAETCVPLILEGPEIVRARAALITRAQALGYVITNDSDAHVVADGARIDPVWVTENSFTFVLPETCESLELRSRGFIPAHVLAASADERELGLSVAGVQIDGDDLDLTDDEWFGRGWHRLEQEASGARWRWTERCVPLPRGARLIAIKLAGPSTCWDPARSARTMGTVPADPPDAIRDRLLG